MLMCKCTIMNLVLDNVPVKDFMKLFWNLYSTLFITTFWTNLMSSTLVTFTGTAVWTLQCLNDIWKWFFKYLFREPKPNDTCAHFTTAYTFAMLWKCSPWATQPKNQFARNCLRPRQVYELIHEETVTWDQTRRTKRKCYYFNRTMAPVRLKFTPRCQFMFCKRFLNSFSH